MREDPLVELAKDCVKMCHVLKSVAEGRGAGNLAGPGKREIEDLVRCVNPVQPSLPNITSEVRAVHHIESSVRERANRARGLQKHHPGSTKGNFAAWQTEIWEILGIFGVRGSQLEIATVFKLPQGGLGRVAGLTEVSEINQHVHCSVNAEPLCQFYSLVDI